MDLGLKDKVGSPVQAHIKIKLSLLANFAEAIMQGVDARLPRLNENKLLSTLSGGIDAATSSAPVGYDAVQTLGTYITPLGQALQLIVKIMDNVADVGFPTLYIYISRYILNRFQAHPVLKVSWIVLSSVYKVSTYSETLNGELYYRPSGRATTEATR
jgi:hypothetical protein